MSVGKSYFLKTALMARGLAELTVLVILSLLPLLLIVSKQFFALHLVLKIAVCCLSPTSALGVWGLLRIPFRVDVSEIAISVRSIIKRESLAWSEIISLRQSSAYGLKQYVLQGRQATLNFPRMLNNVGELVSQIRAKIPGARTATISDGAVYRMAKISFLIDCFKWLLQLGFAIFFAQFARSLAISGTNSQADLFIIYAAAVLIFLGVFWNFVQLIRLPQALVLDKEGMSLKFLFWNSRLVWDDLKGLKMANVFYPEGLCVRSAKGSIVISANTNDIDELSEILSSKLSAAELSKNTSS